MAFAVGYSTQLYEAQCTKEPAGLEPLPDLVEVVTGSHRPAGETDGRQFEQLALQSYYPVGSSFLEPTSTRSIRLTTSIYIDSYLIISNSKCPRIYSAGVLPCSGHLATPVSMREKQTFPRAGVSQAIWSQLEVKK